MRSDSEKFEIFNSNFEINPKYRELIEESIEGMMRIGQIFREADMDELVNGFLRYLFKNNEHHYLTELIKRRTVVNGEERYSILKLEVLKSYINESIKTIKESLFSDLYIYPPERLMSIKNYLSKLNLIYSAMISKAKINYIKIFFKSKKNG